jgi:hypoxanthine phosphoribosyltransferase
MILSLTNQVRKLLDEDARKIAFRMGNEKINSEHLLISLLEDKDNYACQALLRFNADLKSIHQDILSLAKTKNSEKDDLKYEEIKMSQDGARIVDCAREEAHTMGHYEVGIEHLFLGLIREGEGLAYRVLSQHGVSLTRARKEVWFVLNEPDTPPEHIARKKSIDSQSGESQVFHNHPDIQEILISEKQLKKRIKDIAHLISADFEGREPLLISILKGSILFLSDLLREITIPCKFDLMTVSSYGDKTVSSGNVKLVMDLKQDVKGKDIIIVEDIYDTGNTLKYIIEHIKLRGPRTLKTCTLLSKKARHQVHIDIDYVGFNIPDEFVVGYGLDYAERYRHLPYIGILKPEVYTHPKKKD